MTVSASGSPLAVVPHAVTVPGGGELIVEALIPGAVRDGDLLYFEFDTTQAAVIELRPATSAYWRSVIASSQSPDLFVDGALSGVPQPEVPAAGAAVGPAALGANPICPGPCVIVEPAASSYLVRLVNKGAGAITGDLLVFGDQFDDEFEPANDLRTNPGVPTLEHDESGAIETLGDVDYWLATEERNVVLTRNGGPLEVRISVYDTCGVSVAGPYAAGEPFRVYPGEAIRVSAALVGGKAVAAPSGRSGYSIQTSPPDGSTVPRDPSCGQITATNDRFTPVTSEFLSAHETATFVLTVPSAVRSRPLLQVELNRDVALEVVPLNGGDRLLSASRAFFSRAAGFSRVDGAGAMSPTTVTPGPLCGGSCVVVPSPGSSYLIRITNGPSSGNVQLYAFGRGYEDQNEPANNSQGGAPGLPVFGSDQGAIETVGDVDYWEVQANGFVYFTSGDFAAEAHLLPLAGSPILIGSDGLFALAGEIVRVRATNADRAAVAGLSVYTLEHEEDTTGNFSAQRRR